MLSLDELLAALRASHGRAGRPKRLLIGLSGGADSMALTALLRLLREELALALYCVHVHHGLRGASDSEEVFVMDFCRREALPLVIKRLGLIPGPGMEERARKARYQAFRQAMEECAAEELVLGHHADDQAETVLMRLMRGAGSRGLAAMREYHNGIWRPLLPYRRDEILAALADQMPSWMEDESNADTDLRRNALRSLVLPQMERISPGCTKTLCRSALILADEADYWRDFAQTWLKHHASTRLPLSFLMVEDCRKLPIAARRQVLYALCKAAGVQAEFDHIERLNALLEAKPQASENLSGNIRAFRSHLRLHLVPPERCFELPGRLVTCDPPALPGDRRSLSQAFDAEALQGAILRFRQPGDRIAALGAGGSRPLNEYFVDHRIDRPFRDAWPILARGQQVLWVPGVGIADTAAVRDSSARLAGLRYEGLLPDSLNDE